MRTGALLALFVEFAYPGIAQVDYSGIGRTISTCQYSQSHMVKNSNSGLRDVPFSTMVVKVL